MLVIKYKKKKGPSLRGEVMQGEVMRVPLYVIKLISSYIFSPPGIKLS